MEITNEILICISEYRLSVPEISEKHGITTASVYKMLSSLAENGVIEINKSGRNNIYRLKTKRHRFSYKIKSRDEDSVFKSDISPLLKTLPEIPFKNIGYAFTEIFNNANEHSEGTTVNVMVSRSPVDCTIIISDDGVGIFKKIQDALSLEEEKYAVLELAKGKFTSEPKSHSGEGIFFSSKATDLFAIVSHGIEFLSSSSVDPLLIEKRSTGKGTTVLLKINDRHSESLGDVFNKYTQAPDDYGFSKTVVPVRLLEYKEDRPTFVSRSQAKRLLARFDKFNVICLDFDGVDEIGQGFADEIFRVFRNEHPDCKINTINTNENVLAMIKRIKQ